MKMIYMTPAEWAQVRDNPIQRNTEAHAKKALRSHLSVANETQSIVAAAQLPDGTLVKLDGHTRSLLWSNGQLKPPKTVTVVTFSVRNLSETIPLYRTYDNQNAAEDSSDRLAGAFRLQGIAPQSKLLQVGGITSALQIIASRNTLPIGDLVQEWKPELELLDTLDTSPSKMAAPLVAAALLTLRNHGPKALQFWRTFIDGGGTRIDGKSCGVDELTRIVAELRARRLLSSGGLFNVQQQSGRAISCCDAWLQGRSYTSGAKATDFKSYLANALSKSRLL